MTGSAALSLLHSLSVVLLALLLLLLLVLLRREVVALFRATAAHRDASDAESD